jgi:hypothetical protein
MYMVMEYLSAGSLLDKIRHTAAELTVTDLLSV